MPRMHRDRPPDPARPPAPAPPCQPIPAIAPPPHPTLRRCAQGTPAPTPDPRQAARAREGLQLWERRGVAIGTPPSRSVLQSSTGRADGCLTQSGFAMSTKRPSDGGGALTPRQRRSRRSSSSMTQARELAGSREYTASASRCKSH